MEALSTPPGLGLAHLRAYLVIGALAIGLPTALLPYVAPNLPVSVLTLVLALWVVVKYAKQTQPAALHNARAEERAAKRAELRAADEKALTSFGVTDPALKR